MTATQQLDPFGTTPSPRTQGPAGPRSGFWRRFAASLIDAVLITICAIPLLVIDVGLYKIVNLLGQVAYYTALEGGPRGQTLGKRTLRIRVVALSSGGPIGYGRAFIRYVGRYVSFFVLLIGYVRMLWHREKQTWHDQMARAVVVRTGG